MNWCKSLTAALIAIVTLTPVPSGAQSSPNLPTGAQSSPDASGSAVPRVQQGPANYVGLNYRILPIGLQDLGGWLVGEPIGGRFYAIQRVQQEQKQMLWLNLVLPPDPQGTGTPVYQVVDIIDLPQIQNLEDLAGSPGLPCIQNGVRDPELIAIAKYDDAEYWRQIKRAWRANRKTGKFEQISPGNIVCDNSR